MFGRLALHLSLVFRRVRSPMPAPGVLPSGNITLTNGNARQFLNESQGNRESPGERAIAIAWMMPKRNRVQIADD
jgi:hypothetical protein